MRWNLSCNYGLYCITCTGDDKLGKIRNPDSLLAIIPNLPALANLARLGYAIDVDRLDTYGEEKLYGLADWARAHEGHEVRVRDDYGTFWPEAAEIEARAKRLAKFREAVARCDFGDMKTWDRVVEAGEAYFKGPR